MFFVNRVKFFIAWSVMINSENNWRVFKRSFGNLNLFICVANNKATKKLLYYTKILKLEKLCSTKVKRLMHQNNCAKRFGL